MPVVCRERERPRAGGTCGGRMAAYHGEGEHAMPDIPSTINSVSVEFASTVDKEVKQRLIDGLKHCIKHDIASGHKLEKIWVSSAADSHKKPSRHVYEKAIDISRINGKKMSLTYTTDKTVKAICDGIQDTFESYTHRRENFGPKFTKKHGITFPLLADPDSKVIDAYGVRNERARGRQAGIPNPITIIVDDNLKVRGQLPGTVVRRHSTKQLIDMVKSLD